MYCNKCGKEIEGNVKFCTLCGEKIEQIETLISTQNATPSSKTGIGNNLFNVVSMLLFGILAFTYLVTAFKSFEGNQDAFEWLSDGYKTTGMILHWVISLVVLCDCLQGINGNVKNKSLAVSSAISLIVITSLIWIGKMICNDFEFEDMSILLYRLFGTYGQLTASSYLLSIGALICSVIGSNNNK